MLRIVFGGWIALIAATISVNGATIEREQLPAGVTPLHYDLTLVPDIANLTFRGQVRITIDVSASTSAIVLNADELTLDKAVLDTKETAENISLDAKLQRATLTFGHPAATGRHTLAIDYHGAIGLSTL